MKKLTVLFSAFVLVISLSSNLSAQNLSAGAGVHYATSLNNIGISINGNYKLTKKIHLAASYIYFLEKDLVNWSALDFDGHYIFSENSGMQIYGIAGLGFTFTSIEVPGYSFGGISAGSTNLTATNFGLNLGAGLHKKLSKNLNLFAEAKYAISDGSYLKIGAGVLYNF